VAGCPTCGAAFQPGAKFCGECGTRLTDAAPAAATAGSGPIPAAIANTERRLVTVLFADLVGFTTLAEGRDSEAVRELLGRYFDHGKEIVRRYGGTVEKFIGDAVMAVWGTPVAHEDDAERAVRAGLEMIDAVRGLSVEEGGAVLQARVGILTGEAAVDLRATDQGMVAGDLVNTASRLQSVAPPGTVLVGEATMAASSGAIAFETVGEADLKGKAAPVATWRAVRVIAKRGGIGRADGLEPPFVGRDTEFRLLRHLLHAAGRERRAHLVSLTGQAGIGKSRLAWELNKYVDGLAEDIYWHHGRSPSYGEGIAFWALGEMVRKRCGLAERDDEATTRARVTDVLRDFLHDETERAFVEPTLLTLLGLGEPPAGGRERLFAGWRTLFERVAERGTVVLVFEDLHWADDGLLDFIEHLMEWSRSHPLLVVTLSRPEILDRRPTWGIGQRNGSALALAPIAEADMRMLLAGMVPGLPGRTTRTILERADGIPLYAVETVRMLVADGRLVQGPDGRLTPAAELGQLDVPGSLRGLIAARLDGLDPEDRVLVSDASILGKTFVPPALAAVSGLDVEALEPRLRGLTRRELLELNTDPRSPERGQYGFVQALIREVAYATLSKRDRRSKHLAAARYFESHGDDELAGALATHYLAAYEAMPDGPEGEAIAHQARISLRAAAERATTVGANEQALGHLRAAMRIPGTSPVERADLLERAGNAAVEAGRSGDAEPLWQEAIGIRTEIGEIDPIANAVRGLAQAQNAAHRIGVAVETVQAELQRHGELMTDEARARLLVLLGRALIRQNRPDEAIAVMEDVLKIAEANRLTGLMSEALAGKASALSQVGRPLEASIILDAVIRIAEELGDVRMVMSATGPSVMFDIDEDPRRSVAKARASLDLMRRMGNRGFLVNVVLNATEAAIRTGEWTWAREQLDELLSLDLEPGDKVILAGNRISLDLLQGRDATELVEEVEALVAETPDLNVGSASSEIPMSKAIAEGDDAALLAAATLAAREDLLNAPAFYERAIRAALWLGDLETAVARLRDLQATGRHGRATDAIEVGLVAGVAALEGRRDEAIEGFRSAIGELRSMGATFAEALAALDGARLLGIDTPEGRELAAVARPILEGVGAVPYLRRLDEIGGSTEGAAGSRTPRAAGDVELPVSRSA
jgi:class 3 adenylate cyclase/tetratricopeptide (TPR) repeat protein